MRQSWGLPTMSPQIVVESLVRCEYDHIECGNGISRGRTSGPGADSSPCGVVRPYTAEGRVDSAAIAVGFTWLLFCGAAVCCARVDLHFWSYLSGMLKRSIELGGRHAEDRPIPPRAAIALSVAVALAACAQPSDAVTTKRTPTTKAKRVTKRTAPLRTTTKKPAPTTRVTSTTVAQSTLVRAGYEAYLTAYVAAARNPEKASTLLPLGMTGADARDPSPRCEGRRLLGRNSHGHR